MDKIRNFTDLVAWQKGHKFVLAIYSTLSKFPSHEKYALCDQMRRASVSITSNIAEGFSRNSTKEKAQFFYMSLGSLTEIQNQIFIARDLGYMEIGVFRALSEQSVEVSKLVNGLIRKLNTDY